MILVPRKWIANRGYAIYTNLMGNKYLDILKEFLLKGLKDEPVKVYLFGSRATGKNRPGSDVDIGLLPNGKINSIKISMLKEDIEESDIPYKVDIVNLSETSEDFRRHALQGAILWKS